MLQDGGSIPSYTLLVTKTPTWWCRTIEDLLSRPLAIFHTFKTMRKQNCTKDVEGLEWSRLFFNPQPWPIYIAREGEKIDFARVMELKSDMEIDRHSGNSGDGSWKNNRFRFIASHNYKISWDRYERFTLTIDQSTKASLDWRESGSPQGQRSSWTKSHRPVDKIASGASKDGDKQ